MESQLYKGVRFRYILEAGERGQKNIGTPIGKRTRETKGGQTNQKNINSNRKGKGDKGSGAAIVHQ